MSDDNTSDTIATWCAERCTSRRNFTEIPDGAEGGADVHYIGNRPRICQGRTANGCLPPRGERPLTSGRSPQNEVLFYDGRGV